LTILVLIYLTYIVHYFKIENLFGALCCSWKCI